MLKKFAEQYNLRVRRDDCGDSIVQGKAGSIGDGYTNGLGVYITLPTVRRWNAARHQLVGAGFQIRQNGDAEGVLVFNPNDEKQARLAIQFAHVKSRRKPSLAQLAALVSARIARAA